MTIFFCFWSTQWKDIFHNIFSHMKTWNIIILHVRNVQIQLLDVRNHQCMPAVEIIANFIFSGRENSLFDICHRLWFFCIMYLFWLWSKTVGKSCSFWILVGEFSPTADFSQILLLCHLFYWQLLVVRIILYRTRMCLHKMRMDARPSIYSAVLNTYIYFDWFLFSFYIDELCVFKWINIKTHITHFGIKYYRCVRITQHHLSHFDTLIIRGIKKMCKI